MESNLRSYPWRWENAFDNMTCVYHQCVRGHKTIITMMRLSILFMAATGTAAFTTSPFVHHGSSAAIRMSSTAAEASPVPVVITGNNIEVTPALEEYVNKRLERPLGKLAKSGSILDCDVHLSVNKNPKVSVETYHGRVDGTWPSIKSQYHWYHVEFYVSQ